jgi:hypothetical protein
VKMNFCMGALMLPVIQLLVNVFIDSKGVTSTNRCKCMAVLVQLSLSCTHDSVIGTFLST